ncbi:dihydrodipicolinate reductase [bacterium]|nr:dihydrodipicolinate reductase [bacterium]
MRKDPAAALKVALLGYGKMGKIIEQIAERHQIAVVEKYEDVRPLRAGPESEAALKDVPVLIDFSVPDAVFGNVEAAAALKKNLVIGTTGWHSRLEEVMRLAEKSGIGIVHGNNFSLGVHLFYKIVNYASGLIASFREYDPYIEEAHHQFKKDAPSGTALIIQDMVSGVYRRPVPVTSVRAGFIPGTHTLGFDSRVDTLTLSHCARSREGFAEGALIAARWIKGRSGVFGFGEVLDDLMQK